MAILVKPNGEVMDLPRGPTDATIVPQGFSLISYERWDFLTKEKGSEAAVISTMKAVDARQESEKRPVPVAVKVIEIEESGGGIKTK